MTSHNTAEAIRTQRWKHHNTDACVKRLLERACNPNAGEAEAGGLRGQGQPRL